MRRRFWKAQAKCWCIKTAEGKIIRLSPDRQQAQIELGKLLGGEKAGMVVRLTLNQIATKYLAWGNCNRSKEFHASYKLDGTLQCVPGVGETTSATLIAELPELGTLNRKEIASLVGVAPYDHDSGTMKGKRTIWGGRESVRTVLYMTAIVAKRFNPTIHAFAERLKRAGKKSKVIIAAVMRKLLVICNTIVKNNPLWNPELASQIE